METDGGQSIAGWYGKIPCLGDFASRRLPIEFIEHWDAWLQRSLGASRSILGDRWLNIYLTSPLWRFALMPGVIGDSAWVGVLMPSVDKVGRHFPLTIAHALAPRPDLRELIFGAQEWHSALERVALHALDLEVSVDDLERDLAAHPFPLPPSRNIVSSENLASLATWWATPEGAPLTFRFEHLSQASDLIDASIRPISTVNAAGRSLWWSAPPAGGPAALHCIYGLPADEHFAVLLQEGSPTGLSDDESTIVAGISLLNGTDESGSQSA